MSASAPLQLPSEDKLDLLRYLDEFHYWHSLDDERVCKRCGNTITGRQIVVIELQGTRGKLRLQCPTAGCVSNPSDWVYANPVRAAKQRDGSRPEAEKLRAETIAKERVHHGEASAKGKGSASPDKNSVVAVAPALRSVLGRLIRLRPIATALHVFRPAA